MSVKRIAAWLIAAMLIVSPWTIFHAEDEGESIIMFDNVDILKSSPDNYDLDQAVAQGLASEEGYADRYFELQALYAQGIWQLLTEECDIMGLDAMIGDSELNFLPAASSVNAYQAHWSFGAKYLFLRNNICVERLSGEELDELAAIRPDDGALRAFVERTLNTVIRVYPELGDGVEVEYDRGGPLAPNNAIVLGLATSPEYDGNGNYVDAQHEQEKADALQSVVVQAQNAMADKLGVPVTILLY